MKKIIADKSTHDKYNKFVEHQKNHDVIDAIDIDEAHIVLKLLEKSFAVMQDFTKKYHTEISQEELADTYKSMTPMLLEDLQVAIGRYSKDIEFILLNLYNTQDFYKRLKWAVAHDTFRPKNMTILEFAVSPDLANITGDFSTFDRNLSIKNIDKITRFRSGLANIKQKPNMTDEEIVADLISDAPTNLYEVTKEKLRAFYMAYNHSELYKMHDTIIQYGENFPSSDYCILLTLMISDMASYESVPYAHVSMPEPWPGSAISNGEYTQFFIPELSRNVSMIMINRQKIIRDFSFIKNPKARNKAIFDKILETVAHEYSHHVDVQSPNKGAVGAQKMHLQNRAKYDELSNPSEQAAYFLSDLISANQKD